MAGRLPKKRPSVSEAAQLLACMENEESLRKAEDGAWRRSKRMAAVKPELGSAPSVPINSGQDQELKLSASNISGCFKTPPPDYEDMMFVFSCKDPQSKDFWRVVGEVETGASTANVFR